MSTNTIIIPGMINRYNNPIPPLTPSCYQPPPVIYSRGCPPTIASLIWVPPVHGSKSICFPSPFSPKGGALEWQSNELIMKDQCLRKLAGVAPLDCGITDLYIVNPIPKL